MNSEKLMDAIGGVNDSYIAVLMEEKPCKRKVMSGRCMRWIAAAACLCLIVGGIIHLHSKGTESELTFAISAYAKSADGKTETFVVLKQSERVPIDVMYAEKGETILAFSYDTADPERQTYIAQINGKPNTNVFTEETVYRITADIEKQGKAYIFYSPDPWRQMPYTISVPIGPDGPVLDYIYQANLIISQTDGQYYVELAGIEKVDVVPVSGQDETNRNLGFKIK